MQRIDENTYIDETLVTCAEYQLFIDEMREQGKYYQPDHWTSYRFPEGQARKPILGVRHSDAVTFCDWLTKRDGKEWKYRLPSHSEATFCSIIPVEHKPTSGFWIIGVERNSRFEWAEFRPTDARSLRNLENIFSGFIDPIVKYELDIGQGKYREWRRDPEFAKRKIKLAQKPMRERVQLLVNGLRSTCNLPLDLGDILDDYLNVHIGNLPPPYRYRPKHGFDSTADFRCLQRRNLENGGADIVDICKDTFRIALEISIHSLSLAVDKDLDFMSELVISMFTIEERIAGRSPAFEGIRLVKERTR